MSQGQSSSKLPKKYQGNFIWSYGEVDPSAVATLGAKNQFYVNLTDGTLYQKNDEGVTTNWSVCAFSSSGPSQITVNSQNGVEELDFQGEIQVVVSGNTATLTLPKRVGTVGGFTDTDTIVLGTGLSGTQSNPNEVTLDVTIPPSEIEVDSFTDTQKIVTGANLTSTQSNPNEVTLDVTIPTPTIQVGAVSGVSNVQLGTNLSLVNDGGGQITLSASASPTGDPNTVSFFNGSGNLVSNSQFTYDQTKYRLGIGNLSLDSSRTSSLIIGSSSSQSIPSGNFSIFVGQNNSFGSLINSSIIMGENKNLSAVVTNSFVIGSNTTLYAGGSFQSAFVLSGGLTLSRCHVMTSIVGGITFNNNSGSNFIKYENSIIFGDRHSFDASSANVILTGCLLIGREQTVNVSSNYLTLLGRGHNVNGDHITAIGSYSNFSADTNQLFIIGNGIDNNNRSNAFDVGRDGLIREYGAKRIKIKGEAGATYTLNARTDYAVEFTNNGAITITLPSGINGQKYELKLSNVTTATINAASGETINGLSSYLLGLGLCCSLIFRNGNWIVCANSDEVIDYDNLSKYMSDKDTGIFKTIEWKTSAGVLRKKSVLSGGTAPQFTTRTVTFYDQTGTLISSKTLTYTLSYDVDGDVTSEVL